MLKSGGNSIVMPRLVVLFVFLLTPVLLLSLLTLSLCYRPPLPFVILPSLPPIIRPPLPSVILLPLPARHPSTIAASHPSARPNLPFCFFFFFLSFPRCINIEFPELNASPSCFKTVDLEVYSEHMGNQSWWPILVFSVQEGRSGPKGKKEKAKTHKKTLKKQYNNNNNKQEKTNKSPRKTIKHIFSLYVVWFLPFGGFYTKGSECPWPPRFLRRINFVKKTSKHSLIKICNLCIPRPPIMRISMPNPVGSGDHPGPLVVSGFVFVKVAVQTGGHDVNTACIIYGPAKTVKRK